MEFGEINEVERAMAIVRGKEALQKGMPLGMDAYEVAVVVYVNGRLVYHGGHTVGCKRLIERRVAKMVACRVLGGNMNEEPWTEDEEKKLTAPVDDSAKPDPIERVIRDAVIDYNESFASAPNDDCERELRERAKAANDWLVAHGYKPEPFDHEEPKK